MAAPTLRHYVQTPSSTSQFILFTVPASRALVVSKLLIAGTSSATSTSTASVVIGSATIVRDLALAAGQVYTETGLVLTAGEELRIQSNAASSHSYHVFGEEVDN